MPIQIMAGETNANARKVYFQLVGPSGVTAVTGETGQPQITSNGGEWTDTGISTLTEIGYGRYYATLTTAAVASVHTVIETRYKSTNTAECPGTTVQVVGFDPNLPAMACISDANTVTITVEDGNGDPVSGVDVYVETADEASVIVHGNTDVSGEVVFGLPDDTYKVVIRSNAMHSPTNPYDLVVSGTTTETYTIDLVDVPSPITPSSVTLYSYEYNPEGNVALGASKRTAYIHRVVSGKYSPSWNNHFKALSSDGAGVSTDANGLWSMSVPTGVKLIVKVLDTTTNDSEYWEVTIPSTSGTYALWDLSPKEVLQ